MDHDRAVSPLVHHRLEKLERVLVVPRTHQVGRGAATAVYTDTGKIDAESMQTAAPQQLFDVFHAHHLRCHQSNSVSYPRKAKATDT